MKAQHPIDDLFRHELGDRQAEAPMHLWAGIARQVAVPQKKRRKKYLLVLAAAALGYTALLPSDIPSRTLGQKMGYNRTASPSPEGTATTSAPVSKSSPAALPGGKIPVAVAAAPATLRGNPLVASGVAVPAGAKKGGMADLYLPDAPAEEAAPGAVVADETPVRDAFYSFAALPSLSPQLELAPIRDVMPGFRFLGERWYASFDLSVSNEWRQRSLIANSPDYQGYADLRDASEQLLNAHSAALRLSLISASGIALKSGIQISSYTESFLQSRTERVAVPNPIRDANGQVIGMDTLFQNRSYQWTTKNQFHTIDIPVLVGYEFALGRFNIGLNGGALLNMAFNQQGTFLGPDEKTVLDFSSNRPDAYPAFKNRLGVGWYGSAQLSFPISPSLRVLAEPYYSAFPRSYTNSDYPITQRYHTMGLFVGVRKLLGPYWLNLKP